MRKTIITALLLVVTASLVVAAEKASLPKGYAKWEKSRQKVVTDKSSLFYGIHYIYVDPKAMGAYKTGGPYPEGSRFIVEYFGIKDQGGKPVQGKKSMIVLMKKDRRFKNTGGWLFAGFNPDGKLSGIDPVKNCFGCHLKDAKNSGYVISKYADFR